MGFFENLKEISKTTVKNESMKKHTSFKIGGNADFMVFPETVDEIKKIIELCNKNDVPFMIMGNGSNMLVSDEGIEGVVVKISTQMSKIKIFFVRCKTGAPARLTGEETKRSELS